MLGWIKSLYRINYLVLDTMIFITSGFGSGEIKYVKALKKNVY